MLGSVVIVYNLIAARMVASFYKFEYLESQVCTTSTAHLGIQLLVVIANYPLSIARFK